MSDPIDGQVLARAIASALADERVRRHNSDMPPPSIDEERTLARATATGVIAQFRGTNEWGLGAIPELEDRRIIEESIAQVLGLGRLEPLLEDDDVSDIHVRGNAPVWVKLRSGERKQCPPIVATDDELIELIRRIAARMGHREQRFDPSHPELNLQLPDGSRLFAAMEVSSRPMMVVRRHRFEYSSLGELASMQMMTHDVARFLAAAVRARQNIIIAGGTGSGKTTLLRALMNEIPSAERIVTIEDAFELGIEHFEDAHPDHDALQTRSANTEGFGEISMSDLTRMALRMDPDRVIVGEVRGAEAFPMLLAMTQGNNGSMCTMHAESARSVFSKLLAYVSMSSIGLPPETVNILMAGAINLIVHVQTLDGRKRVTSIHEVVDAEGSTVISNELFSDSGHCEPFAAMRTSTADLLEMNGFSRRRELQWIS